MANHITQWKPEVTINVREFGETISRKTGFSTYRELVKNMKLLLQRSTDNEVFVSRSIRGEWGERFEYWQMYEGKPRIFKEGWM
jgi:hypothetical protein